MLEEARQEAIVTQRLRKMRSRMIFQIGILALFLVALSSFASAQVCQATLSAPTKEVYVGDDFNVTFFNGELNSTGDTLTLGLPPEISLVAGSNPVSPIAPLTAYSWTVQASSAGTFTINASINGTVNCTVPFDSVVVEAVPAPVIVPAVTDIGTVTLNQPVGVELNLTNVGGLANDVDGYIVTSSGSTLSPNDFSHASIANSTTVSTSHILIPLHCGVDSVTAHVQDIHDANGIDVAPVQVTDMFTVVGSDVAFTTVDFDTGIAQGAVQTFAFTVENIGLMDTTNVEVEVLVNGTSVGTEDLGSIAVGASSSGSVDYDTGSLFVGTHDLTFRVSSDIECSSLNNEVSTTFDVTSATGPFCGDGSCNGGETCSSCPADCGSCSSGSSSGGGGGGGGGGRTGDTYILVLTEDNPTKSLKLKTGDTVKYSYRDEDYSFVYRYVYSDRAKMGVSHQASYKEFTLMEDTKHNLNLDDNVDLDLRVTPTDLHGGSGNFTFTLLGVVPKKPIITLPFPSKKTVEPEKTGASADLEAEPDEPEPEEETYSEGVLEFIESLNVKSSAPVWAGVGLALLIILLGLGLYFLVARKED